MTRRLAASNNASGLNCAISAIGHSTTKAINTAVRRPRASGSRKVAGFAECMALSDT